MKNLNTLLICGALLALMNLMFLSCEQTKANEPPAVIATPFTASLQTSPDTVICMEIIRKEVFDTIYTTIYDTIPVIDTTFVTQVVYDTVRVNRIVYDTIDVTRYIDIPIEEKDTFIIYQADTIPVNLRKKWFVGETTYTFQYWDSIIQNSPFQKLVRYEGGVSFFDVDIVKLSNTGAIGYWADYYNLQDTTIRAEAVTQMPKLKRTEDDILYWDFESGAGFEVINDSLNFEGSHTVLIQLGPDIGTKGAILSKSDSWNLERVGVNDLSLNGQRISTSVQPNDVIVIRHDAESENVSVEIVGQNINVNLDAAGGNRFRIGQKYDGSNGYNGTLRKVLFAQGSVRDSLLNKILDLPNWK